MALACVFFAMSAVSASATTLQLRFDTTRDPANFFAGEITPDGSAPYGLVRGSVNQTFTVAVTADDGSPVTGCLISEVVELVDLDGKVYAVSQCADPTTKLFHISPTPQLAIDRPTDVYARVTASTAQTSDGQTLSPANSNFALMFVEPRIFDDGPKAARGKRFLVKIRVGVPSPRPEKGTIVLQRRSGAKWVTLRTRAPNELGRFSAWVALPAAVNVFRVRFVPKSAPGVTTWLPAEVRFRIRKTAA